MICAHFRSSARGPSFPGCSDRSDALYSPVTSTGAECGTRDGGPSGHSGPAHPQVAVAGAVAWLGDRRPDSPHVAERLPDRAGFLVSRPPPLRASGVGDVLLAHDRTPPHRAVLRAHSGGKGGPRRGRRAVAVLHPRCGSRPRGAIAERRLLRENPTL